jgi:hypothetical protein
MVVTDMLCGHSKLPEQASDSTQDAVAAGFGGGLPCGMDGRFAAIRIFKGAPVPQGDEFLGHASAQAGASACGLRGVDGAPVGVRRFVDARRAGKAGGLVVATRSRLARIQ